MPIRTRQPSFAQPFSQLIKRAVVDLIEMADSPLEREDRIQSALDEGAITYPDAYALRCGGDL